MEAINILVGRNPPRHGMLTHVWRQRQLHQNAVNLRIVVEFIDQGQKAFFVRAVGQTEIARDDAGAPAGAHLVADINVGRRIVTDQNHGQARPTPAARNRIFDRMGNIFDQQVRDCASVEKPGFAGIHHFGIVPAERDCNCPDQAVCASHWPALRPLTHAPSTRLPDSQSPAIASARPGSARNPSSAGFNANA